MASLKEVKGRIATVQNTQKITSAMKMVASAKLHKAQGAIGNMLPYEEQLHQLLANLLAGNEKVESVYTISREVKKVAIVAFSSNSSFAGKHFVPSAKTMPSSNRFTVSSVISESTSAIYFL